MIRASQDAMGERFNATTTDPTRPHADAA